MEKSSNKLVDLSIAFAIEILNLVKYLKSSTKRSSVIKSAEPEPASGQISTKLNMLTVRLILFQNFKLL
jgi:hypothetical protein